MVHQAAPLHGEPIAAWLVAGRRKSEEIFKKDTGFTVPPPQGARAQSLNIRTLNRVTHHHHQQQQQLVVLVIILAG